LATIATTAQVVRMRRLIISEADRFPDLAADYYGRAPGRVLATLSVAFTELARQGRLHVPDPMLAAEQFAYLAIGAALDRAVYAAPTAAADPARLSAAAAAGVATFLAAHAPHPDRAPEL